MKFKEYQTVENNGLNTLRVVNEFEYNGDCRTNDDTMNMMNELFQNSGKICNQQNCENFEKQGFADLCGYMKIQDLTISTMKAITVMWQKNLE